MTSKEVVVVVGCACTNETCEGNAVLDVVTGKLSIRNGEKVLGVVHLSDAGLARLHEALSDRPGKRQS